jgi:hypothetical protein
MAGEKYEQRAVKEVRDYLAANLPDALRDVEAAQSLTTGTLVDPVVYLQALIERDNRYPGVQVWCERAPVEDYENNVWLCDVTVAIYFAGDADVEAGSIRIRQCNTALTDLLRSSAGRTLGNQDGITAEVTEALSDSGHGPDSEVTHVGNVGVLVRIQED